MGIHSKNLIKKLSNQLDERLATLKKAMEGTQPLPYEVADQPLPDTVTRVTSGDIRVAVDDFNTILKEIKRVLK